MKAPGFQTNFLRTSLLRTTIMTAIFLGTIVRAFPQQAEKYGNVTFTAPKDWIRNTAAGYLAFTKVNQNSGEFARIILYQEEKSSGSLDVDFKEDWQSLVVKNYQPKELTDFSKTSFNSSWNAIVGVAPYTYQNQNQAVVLVTISNGERKTSYVFLSNTTAYEKELEAFGSSMDFSDPWIVANANKKEQSKPLPKELMIDQQLLGKWNRSASVSPLWVSPAQWGTSGYTTCRYNFLDNGTYEYTERNFSNSFGSIIVVREFGDYTARDGLLTVNPKESWVEKYAKKNGVDELGVLEERKSRTLESTSYRYGFHFFEGTQLWNLVLQTDKPTARDGSFSSNTTYSNAYYFDRRFTESNLLK